MRTACVSVAMLMLAGLFLSVAISPGVAQAVDGGAIHVSPAGDDDQPGTADEPLASLRAAQEAVRERLAADRNRDVTVVVHDGVYRINEPLRFGPADAAADGHTVTWRAAEGAEPRISGGRRITGWQRQSDGSLVTTIDAVAAGDWAFRELFVNGERRDRARHPNGGYARMDEAGEDRRTNFTFHAEELPAALQGDLSESGLEVIYLHDWSTSRVRVGSIDREENRLHVVHPIGHSAPHYRIGHFEAHPRYYLENHPTLLDAAGEWYLDEASGELTYMPLPGESAGEIEAVAPVAERLLEVRGEPGDPVQGLVFRGLHFEHAGWSLPEGGYAAGQSAVYEIRDAEGEGSGRHFIPAALMFEDAEDCAVEGGSIRHIGRSGIWFGKRCANNRLIGTLVDDIAGNGVMVGEDTSRRVDGEPWWRVAEEQVAVGQVIEDNTIQRCGNPFFEAVGIWVGIAADTEIRHNLLRRLPYTGVSVGWMWNPTPTPNRGTIIEANHIHHVMQVLSDGGGIYTLGRQPDAVFRENLIHDVPLNLGRAESNGMFLDQGTTELLIERNVIYNIDRSPLRFHQAEENLARDNLLVLADEGTPPVRYNATPEENIELIDNRSPLQADFDPASVSELRDRVGPRPDRAQPPEDPGETFAR